MRLSLILYIIASIAVAIPDKALAQDDSITINLAENADIDLAGLVRWLSETKKIQVFTEQGIFDSASQRLLFYGTETAESGGQAKLSFQNSDELFHFVQVVLRSNSLAIVKSDDSNFYRIVKLGNVKPFAKREQPGSGAASGEYITAIFKLENIRPTDAKQNIDTFVLPKLENQQFDAVVAINPTKILVVTEIASVVSRVQKMIEQMDVEQPTIVTEFYDVQNLEAGELETQLKMILDETDGMETKQNGEAVQVGVITRKLKIASDSRTNRLILIGYRKQIADVLKLVKEDLDVPINAELQTHQFSFVSAEKIDELVKQSLQALEQDVLNRVYQSTIDEQSNQLIVRARKEIHEQIEFLKSKLDKEVSASERRSPIRFYQLKNVKATDILQTLQSIERQVRPRQADQQNERLSGFTTRSGIRTPGANNPNSSLEGAIPISPNFARNTPNQQDARLPGDSPFNRFGGSSFGETPQFADGFNRTENVIPGQARITVDENTNTLIVVAAPKTQQLYAELIERLDKRRPQVLIEITVVTIRDTDSFNLGIELSGGDREGAKRLFSFTNLGLAETQMIDAATGALTISPGLGFNGTLVDPATADVVLRALATHERSRVIAAPRILVNDNATGVLSSVAEIPFASLNASNTVATTSFAGFAQAGTTISVTPQISEGDFLNLEFDVLVNNFSGTGSDGLPPARNTDQITSEVVIPNGHTVIIGGLERLRRADSRVGLPFIEKTILDLIARSETKEYEHQRLFVFIKPIILQDDKFRDLQFLSEIERREAGIPDQFPDSKPILIE